VKKFLLKLLTLVCFGVLVGGTLAEPMTGGLRPQVVQAADTAPTPERSPSKDGWAWSGNLASNLVDHQRDHQPAG
jgi:hypothetical protein